MMKFLKRLLKIKLSKKVGYTNKCFTEEKVEDFCENQDDFNNPHRTLVTGKISSVEDIEEGKTSNEEALKEFQAITAEGEDSVQSFEAIKSPENVTKLEPTELEFSQLSQKFKLEDQNWIEKDADPLISSKDIDLEKNIGEKNTTIQNIEAELNPTESSLSQEFDRESYMQQIVFPEMRKFTNEKFCRISGNVAESFKLKEVDLVSQENERKKYVLWSRVEPMAIDCMLLLVSSLGQWHGCNLAFRSQNPEVFQVWSEKLYNVMPKYLAEECCLKLIIKNMKKMLGILETLGHQDLVEKYEKKLGTFGDTLLQKPSKYSVITFHGDCWSDNINFKYQIIKNYVRPTAMYFSNFDLSMVDSPIRDLSYIIYSYINKNTLRDFDFIIQVYYRALSNALARLGGDADHIFSFDDFKEEWKKYGMFGVIMSLFEMFDDEDNFRIVDVFVHYGKMFL